MLATVDTVCCGNCAYCPVGCLCLHPGVPTEEGLTKAEIAEELRLGYFEQVH